MTDPSHDHLRALAHPLRLRILSLLTGAAMSAAEAARELGDTQANVSYHLRRLHAAGLLEVAETVRIRGGEARRYRHDPASGRRAGRGDPEYAEALLRATAGELSRRAEQSRHDRRSSTTDAELWLDRRTWEHALRLAHELSVLVHTAARPPRTPGTVRTSTTMALFELR